MKSISLDTKNIQGNFYIGLLLLQENDSLQALKTWTHLLELKPSSSQYIPMLALEMKRLSSKFKLEFAETQQLSSNQLNIKTVFLQTLETLQRYLEKNGGKLEIWTMLISSYANLDFKENLKENCVTYWLNKLQNLNTKNNYFLTLNPIFQIDKSKIIKKVEFSHPFYDLQSINAQIKLKELQGIKNSWFCGSYFGYGFHEDGIKSSIDMLKYLND